MKKSTELALRRALRRTRTALKEAETERDRIGQAFVDVRKALGSDGDGIPWCVDAIVKIRMERDQALNRAQAFVSIDLEQRAAELFMRGRDDAARELREAVRRARKDLLVPVAVAPVNLRLDEEAQR